MIFGTVTAIRSVGRLRRLTVLGFLFCAVVTLLSPGLPLYGAASGPSAGFTVDELISALAKHSPQAAFFEETTFSTILTEPLKTKGVLKFAPPSRLEKHVTQPYEERYVIDGDKLRFESKRKRVDKTISVDDYPALQTYIVALRSTLLGDAVALKRLYRTTLEGELRRWTLTLEPLDGSSQTLLESMRISGEGYHITAIETRASGGDRSVLVITKEVP